jgi:ribosomal protein S18 acetylase RimI-like enzyme
MNIQKLNAKNAKQYQVIRLKALKENPEYYSSSYEEESKRDLSMIESRLSQESFQTFGAFKGDMLVGIVTLARESREKTKHIADIFGMYVDSNYRHQGFGKALMTYVIKQAKDDLNIKQLRLSVTDTNQPAIKLYESFGFISYGLEKNAMYYNQTYYHSLMMALIL